jgi:hypothetical protein
MAYGKPLCACCGSVDGIENHHLYLQSEGCPDDLTVWLCHVCHGRAHGMARRIDMSQRIKAALAAAKARGVRLGNPKGTKVNGADTGRARGTATNVANAHAFAERMAPVIAELAGMSANAAAAELDRRGYATPRGGKWSAQAVLNLKARLGE